MRKIVIIRREVTDEGIAKEAENWVKKIIKCDQNILQEKETESEEVGEDS
jgi:hypothetical protein